MRESTVEHSWPEPAAGADLSESTTVDCREQPVRSRRLAIFAILLTLTAYAVSGSALPPLATTIAAEIGIDYQAFGYIFMTQFLCFALASLGGGYLVHRFDISERSLVLTGVIATAILLTTGTFLPSYLWFLLWIIPLGCSGGLIETFGSILIAREEKGNSSRLLNLSQVFYCLGAIMAPQLVAVLLGQSISWRVVMLILGLLVAVIALVFAVLSRNIPRPPAVAVQPGNSETPSSQPCESALPTTASSTLPAERIHPDWWKDRLFWLLALALLLYVVVEVATASWASAFFEKRFGLTASQAAWRLSLFWTGVISGRSLMLILPGRWTVWPAVIVGSAAMLAGNVALSFCKTQTTATVLIVAQGIAAGPLWPVIVMITQKARESRPFTAGVIAAGAIGAAAGPVVGSWIVTSLGWAGFFPCMFVGAAALFMAVLAAWRLERRA